MNNENIYDCAVIGGGLGGLTLSIQLAKQEYKVILFEKEHYPFHKVCGEYISMESRDFLEKIGLPLRDMDLPEIKKLIVTSPDGTALHETLPLGGFGISRYTIDNELKHIAVLSGVTILENCKVDDVFFSNDIFSIHTGTGTFRSRICCGSYGKRSNLDIKWKRPFISKINSKLNNYIGVKYHVTTSYPADTIALHNFSNGYCGISRIEDGKYCLCYLTNAANLRKSGNSIETMEKEILSTNPFLRDIFANSIKLYEQPLSISQISFQEKSQVENHVLMTGDAAGMITPLCGNGMSMAMHGGKIAAAFIHDHLRGKISRKQMETGYSRQWHKTFGKRLRTGRMIQRFFGKPWLTNIFIRVMKLFPPFTRALIRQTHGETF